MAVLPLAPIADDPKLAAFGKGLLEDVTAKLSELSANHDLEIISPRALEDKKNLHARRREKRIRRQSRSRRFPQNRMAACFAPLTT